MTIKSRFRISSVLQTEKLCAWALLIHTNTLRKPGEKCYNVSLNSCPVFCPSRQMMEHMSYSPRWWSSVCGSSLRERWKERETPWFCPVLRVLRDSSLVWKHYVLHVDVYAACANTTRSACVFWRGRGIGATKLVYHQLCSRSRSVPASVQHFFQLPPPNGGLGRFYCTTLGRLLWPDPEHLALCGLNVLWLWT